MNYKNVNYYKKIGIMGGTFNPIHYAHLLIAETVREKFDLDKIIFIPTGQPPHKDTNNIVSCEHRYNMTKLATSTNKFFETSKIEIVRKGTTYTIDTIKELKNQYPKNTEIYFITGADTISQILDWKNSNELIKLCSFIVVERPHYNKSDLLNHINKLNTNFNGNLHFLDVPSFDISSTKIRENIKLEQSIKYMLPEKVEKYIYDLNLYKNISEIYSINEITLKLKNVLDEKRYIHTQGVANEAVNLAKIYEVNTEKAFIAGLLHDCAKNYNREEKLLLCKKYNILLDEISFKQIDLAHGEIGANIAKFEYGINDYDILNAIQYHTTGRSNMSTLEKIIYLADYIEPNRKHFNGIKKAKDLCYEDLDKAMIFVLKNTIDYIKNNNQLVHTLSVQALDYFNNNLKST